MQCSVCKYESIDSTWRMRVLARALGSQPAGRHWSIGCCCVWRYHQTDRAIEEDDDEDDGEEEIFEERFLELVIDLSPAGVWINLRVRCL